MIPNKIKSIWKAHRPVINGWLSLPCGFSAELMAEQGYDSLTIDTQHGLVDYASMVAMLQAIRTSGVTPIVRTPWLDPAPIMRCLDAGAQGVICPMVNNREQAEAFVSACRYPPAGRRSFGPIRALVSLGADYQAHANDEVLCIAMIETAEAMDNLDAIMTTPGLDAVYIGPADLTLGVADGRLPPGFDPTHPEIVDAIKTILSAAKAAGIRAGLHCGTPEYAARAIGWGFDLVTLLNDARLMANAAKQDVHRMRSLLGVQSEGQTGETSSY